MRFDELQRLLAARLAGRLPGVEGQVRMSPRPRFGWRPGEIPDGVRHSGVLLLLYPVVDDAHVVLTVRDSRLPHHPGQIALPGGAVEPEESVEQAALREAHEEIGVDPARVTIIGCLSPLHVPVSGYVLHPHVAIADERPHWRPDTREVARVLDVPLEKLEDPAVIEVEQRTHGKRRVDIPYFALAGEKVWGATAMVLSEFLCLLGSPPEPRL